MSTNRPGPGADAMANRAPRDLYRGKQALVGSAEQEDAVLPDLIDPATPGQPRGLPAAPQPEALVGARATCGAGAA